MDISNGYQIETPSTFIPWGIEEGGLISLVASANPRHVTDGYWTIECLSLGGLRHMLGFHFEPRDGGVLVELGLFRENYGEPEDSFAEFQRHLENTFGPPDTEGEGDSGFPSYVWSRGAATLRHFVQYRFGLEEHVRLKWDRGRM